MASKRFKRICVLCDGTWQTAENPTPTNIFLLATTVSMYDSNDVPQLVFYDSGIGGTGDLDDQINGGAFGVGIRDKITAIYTTLCMNYSPGDEVYLFGYSRGAYTVRSLAGMINKSGLCRRDELEWVKEAYDLYRRGISSDHEDAKAFRAAHGDRIPVKALVCFDTVGALGIPETVGWPFSMFSNARKYGFHDTTLAASIENAIHVMSIDEDRAAFYPTYMTPNEACGEKQVTQLFFPGSHGGVGGGNQEEKDLSNNTMLFVVNELKKRGCGLEFDTDLLPEKGATDVEPVSVGGWWGFADNAIRFLGGVKPRKIDSLRQVHENAVQRYKHVPKWRPKALEKFDGEILDGGER